MDAEHEPIEASAGAPGDQAPPPPAAAPGADPAALSEEPGSTPEEVFLIDLTERAGRADEYLDLAQRTKADFENFRKRMARDVGAAEARGVGRLAKELLPAIDNLERALAAVEASDDDEHHMTKGLRLVQTELSSALQRAGIVSFAPRGELFDPVEHDAVAQHPVDGTAPGTIVEVLQSGYRLNGAILRPARVIVAGQSA